MKIACDPEVDVLRVIVSKDEPRRVVTVHLGRKTRVKL